MGKLIVGCVAIVSIVLISGIYPAVAVGLTAILIVGMFLTFK